MFRNLMQGADKASSHFVISLVKMGIDKVRSNFQGGSGDICEPKARDLYGGPGACTPWEILKSKASEMPFPALWGKILQNSNGRETIDIYICLNLQFF